jgi:serine/threonine-protein kinase
MTIPPPRQTRELASRAGYDLCELIAIGGFGEVHRARHVASGADVAIKILHPGLVDHPVAVRRFEREIALLRALRHPNIVGLVDSGWVDTRRPYLALELLRGTTLRERQRQVGRLTLEESLAILEPLADALAFAHAHAIVHRDVKPSNVFLAEDGSGARRVVLLDFGIAKLLDPLAQALTAPRETVGTPSCMAPEQLTGLEIDGRTDVYALGVLAYRMLTGRAPFEESSLERLRELHRRARPEPPSALAPIPAELDDVILKAMSKAQRDRHSAPVEFVAELRAAATRARAIGPPVDVRPVLYVRFEARVDDDAPTECFDAAASLPRVVVEGMERAGFAPALDLGATLVFTRERPADHAVDLEVRRAALAAVSALARAVTGRTSTHRHLQTCFEIGARAVPVDEGGEPSSAHLAAATLDGVAPLGILVSPEVLAGLDAA